MIPIDKMQFKTAKKDGETLVRGRLLFEAHHLISRFENHAARFDIEAHVKERMRAWVWHNAYGDIKPLLRELEMAAFRWIPPEHQRHVDELVLKLRALLAFPDEATKAADVVRKPDLNESDAYFELLFAVCRRFEGESRHDTALRYIREAEERATQGPASNSVPNT